MFMPTLVLAMSPLSDGFNWEALREPLWAVALISLFLGCFHMRYRSFLTHLLAKDVAIVCALMMVMQKYYGVYTDFMPRYWLQTPILANCHEMFGDLVHWEWEIGLSLISIYLLWSKPLPENGDRDVRRIAAPPPVQNANAPSPHRTQNTANLEKRRADARELFHICEMRSHSVVPPHNQNELFVARMLVLATFAEHSTWCEEVGYAEQYEELRQIVLNSIEEFQSVYSRSNTGRFEEYRG